METTPDRILVALRNSGHKAFFVGGAVRDMILGHKPSDFDIATDARPERVEEIFRDRGVPTKLVGETFGVTLVGDVEVATFRKDIHCGIGDQHCTVEYADTIEEDLARRDFTCNAMAYDPYTNRLIDPFGGWDDTETGLLRFVGSPADRIKEDPNRMIRAARIAAKLDPRIPYIDERATFSISRHLPLIREYVAPERIGLEIMKAMGLSKPSAFWESLRRLGILEIILPELADTYEWPGGKHHSETVWEHCMDVGDMISPRFPLVRLAGYLHDIAKPPCWCPVDGNFLGHQIAGSHMVEERLVDLKFSTKEIDKVAGLVRLHMHSLFDCGPKAMRKLLRELHKRNVSVCEFIRLVIADHNGNRNPDLTPYSRQEITKIICKFDAAMTDFNAANKPSDLKINGHDVMRIHNLKPGPEVGRVMRHLFGIVDDDPSLNTREHLLHVVSHMSVPLTFLEAA